MHGAGIDLGAGASAVDLSRYQFTYTLHVETERAGLKLMDVTPHHTTPRAGIMCPRACLVYAQPLVVGMSPALVGRSRDSV
jgi:hypothetical protein